MSVEMFYRAYPYLHSANNDIWYAEHPVIRHTRCGIWIDNYGKPKFVLTQARKQWAYATKEEARIGLIKRTQRYIVILKGKLARAEEELEHITGHKLQPIQLLEYKSLLRLE